MQYHLRKARPGEEYTVYAMIAERVKWMDQNDIHQWNDSDYLEVFPLEYYRHELDYLYVLTEDDDDQILCSAILLREDPQWESPEPSVYIHNFVSSLLNPGSGAAFIGMLSGLAKQKGISYLRLDSADDNPRLAMYYEKLGFVPCGSCRDGKYHGILRQKKL